MALIKTLCACPPETVNSNVVKEFGMKRFEYTLSRALEYELAILPMSHILYRVIAVPDMSAMTREYGPNYRLCSVPQNSAQRKTAKYFVVLVKVTSFVQTSDKRTIQ